MLNNQMQDLLGVESKTRLVNLVLPKVSIVIVNFNMVDQLKRCLPTIFGLLYPDFEVIVVDNASNDESIEYLEREYPQIILVKSKDNLGYTGGNNLGFRYATGKYIAILNPDTKVDSSWLIESIGALESNPKAGLAAGKVLLMDDPMQINSCGLDITFTGLSFLRGLGRSASHFNKSELVFGVAGSAFVIKRAVLEKIGGFDEFYFFYYEDTDLSLRANLAGYTCLFVPSAVVYHQYIFKFNPKKCYMQERNRYYSLLKTFRFPTLLLLLPTLLLAEVIAWGYAFLHGRENIRSKYESLRWLLINWKQVRVARQQVQLLRRVKDRVLLRRFSSYVNFVNTINPILAQLLSSMINPLVCIWGRICCAIIFW